MRTAPLRAVVFEGEQKLVVACVDYYVSNQCDTLDQVPAALQRALDTEVIVANVLGQEPFLRLPPVPKRIERLFQAGEPILDMILPVGVPAKLATDDVQLRRAAAR